MAKVLNLNVASLALLGDKSQVRVRNKDGVLQILPSARVLATNLPKGEAMVDVKAKMDNGKQVGARVNLADFGGEVGQAYELVKAKYHWLSLVPVAEPVKGSAFGRVYAK